MVQRPRRPGISLVLSSPVNDPPSRRTSVVLFTTIQRLRQNISFLDGSLAPLLTKFPNSNIFHPRHGFDLASSGLRGYIDFSGPGKFNRALNVIQRRVVLTCPSLLFVARSVEGTKTMSTRCFQLFPEFYVVVCIMHMRPPSRQLISEPLSDKTPPRFFENA